MLGDVCVCVDEWPQELNHTHAGYVVKAVQS